MRGVVALALLAGTQARRAGPRIVGGEDAVPFADSFVISIQKDTGHDCGGSIIGDGTTILTAAHCISPTDDPEDYEVAVHRFNLYYDDEEESPCSATLPVKSILVHPDYAEKGVDAALIYLDGPPPCWDDGNEACVDLNGWLDSDKDGCEWYEEHNSKGACEAGEYGTQPIKANEACCWCKVEETKGVTIDWKISQTWAGKAVRTLGWGATDPEGYDYPYKLQEVELDVITLKHCRKLHRKNSKLYVGGFEMCARRPNKDSCFGDSGGPLHLIDDDDDGPVVQVGIVAWGGDLCANMKEPGVYTKVSSIAPWIAKNVESIECEDDPTWRSKGKNKPCSWAAGGNSAKRCKKKGTNDVKAQRACPKSCGKC